MRIESDEEMERLLRAYRPTEPREGWLHSLSRAGSSASPPWADVACAAMLLLSVIAGFASGRVQARLESMAGAGASSESRRGLAGHLTRLVEMAREVDR